MFKSKLIRALRSVLGQDGEKEIFNVLDTFRQQDFSGRRVLLAEDNEMNIEVAQELLYMVGIQVETALNGQLAVERFKASEPGEFDAILMDMQMPVMDGCEATEAIRKLDRADARWIPIIAVTANTFAEDISRTAKAGMNAHIAKPIDTRILCTTLMKLLDSRIE